MKIDQSKKWRTNQRGVRNRTPLDILAGALMCIAVVRNASAQAQAAFPTEPPPQRQQTAPVVVAPAPAPSTPAAPDPVPTRAASANEENVAHLGETLERFESQFRTFQTAGGLSLLGAGALTLPVGIVIRKNSRSVAGSLVIGLGTGELAGGLVLLLGSSGADADFASLNTSLKSRRAAGKAPFDILSSIELEWKAKAGAAHSRREIIGAISTGVGVLGLGTGTILSAKSVSGLSNSERYGDSAALLAIGGVSLLLGLRELCFEDPIEVAWHARQASQTFLNARTLRISDVTYAPLSDRSVRLVLIAGGPLNCRADTARVFEFGRPRRCLRSRPRCLRITIRNASSLNAA
jgi:hypothetical protein